MSKIFVIKKKINNFNKKIIVSGDKSLSIRWVLLASIAEGKSKSFNILHSEDVKASIEAIKKLGIKVKLQKNFCEVFGKGLDGYNYKSNIVINAKNSGTLGRLILGLLVNTNKKIKIVGDKSLSKRDFKRITDPLQKFGVKFILTKNKNLPLNIVGNKKLKPIKYYEKRGSAQVKSSIIFAGLRTEGTTLIKAKKSRNHTELLCKYLKLPITVTRKKSFDIIKVKKAKKIKPFNYHVPSDISSAAFFIVLTCLKDNSSITIKNVNVNPSRIGLIIILKKMGANILFKNKKLYKGELVADIFVKSTKKLKPINCPVRLNSSSIDEFLLIFLVAAKARGVSFFKNLSELNQKESPRLKWGSKILNLMGIKTVCTNDSIKIFGNNKITINKKIVIKDYLKDHRIFMSSAIAALTFGGEWHIHDQNSINTSFPSFLKILKNLQK
jgi:3-phosphoshikimate 1-carboxyvinyltransferase